MKVLFSLRFALHKFKLLQGIYLGFASLLSIFTAISWAFVGMKTNQSFEFIILLIAPLHAFLAWFFIPSKKNIKIILYASLFSFLTLLLAKYIFYFHFLHFQSAFYIDKSEASLPLIIQYLQWIDKNTLAFFVKEWVIRLNLVSILYMLMIPLSSLLYLILAKQEVKYLDNRREKAEIEHHVIKRRFR